MTRNQEIRSEIMMQLYGARPLALSAEHIEKQARRQGYDYTMSEINSELVFLNDQKQVICVVSDITGQTRWRITADGVLAYERGL